MTRTILAAVLAAALVGGVAVVRADSTVAILDGEGVRIGTIHGELVPSMCNPYGGAAWLNDSEVHCVNRYTLVQD